MDYVYCCHRWQSQLVHCVDSFQFLFLDFSADVCVCLFRLFYASGYCLCSNRKLTSRFVSFFHFVCESYKPEIKKFPLFPLLVLCSGIQMKIFEMRLMENFQMRLILEFRCVSRWNLGFSLGAISRGEKKKRTAAKDINLEWNYKTMILQELFNVCI